MTTVLYIVADVIVTGILVLGLYRPRHGRKDLVISFIGANVGVLAVAAALAGVDGTASLGVGLGLFGVLSIIRLRSTELEQHDVAYFFSSLAIGLIAGLGVEPVWLALSLMVLPVLMLGLVDHGRFMSRARRQRVVVDEAITIEAELTQRLNELLGATVQQLTVIETDTVRDMTIVDVTYRLPKPTTPNPRSDRSGTAPSTGHQLQAADRSEDPAPRSLEAARR